MWDSDFQHSDVDTENGCFSIKKQKLGHFTQGHGHIHTQSDIHLFPGSDSRQSSMMNTLNDSDFIESVFGMSESDFIDSVFGEQQHFFASNPSMVAADTEISELESRQSSMKKSLEPQSNKIGDSSMTNSTKTGNLIAANYDQPESYLFKKRLSRMDASKNKLLVPKEEAEVCFPPLEFPGKSVDLQVYDPHSNIWRKMELKRYLHHSYDMYKLGTKWLEFISWNGLVAGDSVLFYKLRNQALDDYPHSYVLRFEKNAKNKAENSSQRNNGTVQ